MDSLSAVAQGSAEWLAQRVGKLGGTAVGVLEGVNAYTTPKDLVRRMVRELAGEPSEFVMVPAVEHGSMMESFAQEWYEQNFGVTVDETDFVNHQTYDFMGASPDGLIGLDGGIEIKCPFPQYTKKPYSVFDPKKAMYLQQCNMVMEVCDLEWLDFVVYLSPSPTSKPKTNIERLYRNPNWLHEMLPARLLPVPVKGTVPRIDLYTAWHVFIMAEFNDPDRRNKHCGEPEAAYTLVEDAGVARISELMSRKAELEFENEHVLEELLSISTQVDELKKSIVDHYGHSVTDGSTKIQMINRKPSVDYKKAFESLGGEPELLAKELDIASFYKTSNTRSIKVTYEEQ